MPQKPSFTRLFFPLMANLLMVTCNELGVASFKGFSRVSDKAIDAVSLACNDQAGQGLLTSHLIFQSLIRLLGNEKCGPGLGTIKPFCSVVAGGNRDSSNPLFCISSAYNPPSPP